ncbi:MAG TPA: hypothetical protein PK631_00245 [Erysipelotrichaceae bacterium]|nr:hypothetical protein [Erysipelotrichaceae bacterium]
MKKLIVLILALIVLLGLTGCFPEINPKPNPDPDPVDSGLTIEQLWDYLDDYPCYITQEIEDYLVIFENEHDIIIDNSFVLAEETISFYFTDLIDFSYEGDNIYRLEYSNIYSDHFNNGTFWIKFDKEDREMIEMKMYFYDYPNFYTLYADVGFTKDELLYEIGRYDYWVQQYGIEMSWFFKAREDGKFYHALYASSYAFEGPVIRVNYLGKCLYELTVDYPAQEEGINPANDAYTQTHLLIYHIGQERIRFEDHDGNFNWYYPDVGATLEEFYAKAANYYYRGNKNMNYRFYISDGKFFIHFKNTEYNLNSYFEVTSLVYKGLHRYEFTVLNKNNAEVWNLIYNFRDGFELYIDTGYMQDYAIRKSE